jgi:Peptidase family M48
MATPGTLPEAPAPPDRPRPDVLAYPPPTTWRFLLFLAALLSAGLFVGDWVHLETHEAERRLAMNVCGRAKQQQADPRLITALEAERIAPQDAAARCRRALPGHHRAAFAIGGAVAAGAAGLVVLYLVPGVLERRRRLRPIPPGLEPAGQRVAALAAEAGLASPPTLMLGPAAQRDGFSYGTPGRYRIALPRAVAVRWRDASLFDPLVRHELAHVAHHDVALSWLARSVWYALAPLLSLPLLVVGIVSRVSLPQFLWRAALLAGMVQLVSSALLRSREHDADLRAAKAGGPEAVAALLVQARDPEQGWSWPERLVANHPSPARRLAVLQRPQLAAGATFLDGFTAAFLAMLTLPLLQQAFGMLPLSRSDPALVIAVLVAGPLLGGTVGLGLWRTTLVQRVAGGPVRAAPVAVGVAAGLVLGHIASLAHLTEGALGGVRDSRILTVIALAGLGATVLAAGLGELWANAAPALRRARTSWVAALAVNSVLFATVLWAAGSLQLALDWSGWVVARTWLVSVVGSWPTLAAVPVLAAAWALRFSRQGALTPAWLLERGEPQLWPATGRTTLTEAGMSAVAAGLAGAAVIIGGRVLAGPPASDVAALERSYIYAWVAAAAGAAVALALALLVPRRGVGVAVLAGPLASLVAVAGLLAMNTVLGGSLDVHFVLSTARLPLALGLVLVVLVAPAGLLAWNRERRTARVWPAATALSLVAVLAVVAGRDLLIDMRSVLAPADLTQYAPTVTGLQDPLARMKTQAVLARISPESTGDKPAAAAQIRAEVLPPLRALHGNAEAYQPPTPNIRSVHQAAVASLRAMVEGFQTLAVAYETDDAAAFAAAVAKLDEGLRHADAWQAGLANLRAAAGMLVQEPTSTTAEPSPPAPTTTTASAPQ